MCRACFLRIAAACCSPVFMPDAFPRQSPSTIHGIARKHNRTIVTKTQRTIVTLDKVPHKGQRPLCRERLHSQVMRRPFAGTEFDS
jgi:hypothetical protein